MHEHDIHTKTPIFHFEVLTYLWIILISMWGGLVSYLGKKEKFSWGRLTAHLLSASFAGFMTFLACDYAGVSGPVVGVAAGVAGHLGTPAMINLAMKLKIVRQLFAEDKKD